jgi:hypothetical protein
VRNSSIPLSRAALQFGQLQNIAGKPSAAPVPKYIIFMAMPQKKQGLIALPFKFHR